MKRSFSGVVWDHFRSVRGPVLAGVAFLAGLVVYIFAFPDNLGARLVVVGVVFLFFLMLTLIFTFASAAYTLYEASGTFLPRAIHGRETFDGIDAILICVLEPSVLFTPGILVAFYTINRQEVEVPMGAGEVVNVQDDGKIQVAMTYVVPGHEGDADRLR